MRGKLITFIYFLLLLGIAIAVILFHKDKVNQTVEISKLYHNNSEFKNDNLSNLPLLKFEVKNSKKNYFLILIPGDGGWRDVIDYISKNLAKNGINVVGFNTIPYFSTSKTPQKIARDLERIIRNFSSVWKKDSVVLGGYSFGAEILPFAYNQLDSITKTKVKKILMLAPSDLADFRVSPIYYYSPKISKKVIPEMNKIDPNMFIIYCDHYKETICKSLPPNSPYETIKINYRHLFIGHFRDVSDAITRRLNKL
jgi:type IV secretory pathway VirJ component